MTTTLLRCAEFPGHGPIDRDRPQKGWAIAAEIDLGECPTIEAVRAAVEDVERHGGEPLDATWRVAWPGDEYLLVLSELGPTGAGPAG